MSVRIHSARPHLAATFLMCCAIVASLSFASEVRSIPHQPTKVAAVSLLANAVRAAEKGDHKASESSAEQSLAVEPSLDARLVHGAARIRNHLKAAKPPSGDAAEALKREVAAIAKLVVATREHHRAGHHDRAVLMLYGDACAYASGLHYLVTKYYRQAQRPLDREFVAGRREVNREAGKAYRQLLAERLANKNIDAEFFAVFELARRNNALLKSRDFVEKLLPLVFKRADDDKLQRLFVTTMWGNPVFQADPKLRELAQQILFTFDDDSLVKLSGHRDFAAGELEKLETSMGNIAATGGRVPADLLENQKDWKRVIRMLDVVCVARR